MVLNIAVDGPAGAGKSTVSKLLARELGISYLDTGAMYRALTYLVLKNNININDKEKIGELARKADIYFLPPSGDDSGKIIINGQDVTDKIRTSKIDKNVSKVAKIKEVRDTMVVIQREIARKNDIIMDGRDIGSRVLPDADLKFFITASLEERSKRRYLESGESEINLEEIKLKIADRDRVDSERKVSPLKRAEDAILIDTTNMSIIETVDYIMNIVKGEYNVKTTL